MARTCQIPVSPRLLSSPQAAQYLGISETKLREMVTSGRITETRIDGCVRFDVRRLDRFIDLISPDDDANPLDKFFGGGR